jgi:hypothetical protein
MNTPIYLNLLFIATTALSIWFFFRAAQNKAMVLLVLLGLAVAQAIPATMGAFMDVSGKPPLFTIVPVSAILLAILLFVFPKGRSFLNTLNIHTLIWLHVEICLYLLFQEKLVPELMTFTGSNPDILSGLTAPLAAIYLYKKGQIKRWGLLLWNLACLALLCNIVARAVLSLPASFQQFGMEQPNVGVLQFPFIWLPGIIVPLVFLSHLAVIRHILFRTPR